MRLECSKCQSGIYKQVEKGEREGEEGNGCLLFLPCYTIEVFALHHPASFSFNYIEHMPSTLAGTSLPKSDHHY